MDWSFSGCGFLGVYHVGVASCLKEYAPHLVNRIYGASGGALAGCCLICDCCLGEAICNLLTIVAKARSRSLGPLHPSFNITKILRNGLNSVLPPNAHQIASGRLFVSLTRVSDSKNVIVSQFDTKEDLIQVLICSSFIPMYCGIIPPTYKGTRYLDGGISDNQPIFDENTITISPFSGETDICPTDHSNSFLSFEITNTNVQINTNNIHRLLCALFPPSAETLSDMCKQGFEDTLRFLQRKSLIACTRCMSLKTDMKMVGAGEENGADGRKSSLSTSSVVKMTRRSPISPHHRSSLRKSLINNGIQMNAAVAEPNLPIKINCTEEPSSTNQAAANNIHAKRHANGKCSQCRNPLCLMTGEILKTACHEKISETLKLEETIKETTLPSKNAKLKSDYFEDFEKYRKLPPVISEAFKAACKKMDHGFISFLLRLPPLKLFAYYVYICLFPIDLFLHISLRFLDWIPYLPGDLAWIFSHFVPLLRLFLRKMCDHKSKRASLTCQIAVSQEQYYEDYKQALLLDHPDDNMCQKKQQTRPPTLLEVRRHKNKVSAAAPLLHRRASWYGNCLVKSESSTIPTYKNLGNGAVPKHKCSNMHQDRNGSAHFLPQLMKQTQDETLVLHHYPSDPDFVRTTDSLVCNNKRTTNNLSTMELESLTLSPPRNVREESPNDENSQGDGMMEGSKLTRQITSRSILSLNDQDAVMSYYYIDEKDGKVKMTEIYDISSPNAVVADQSPQSGDCNHSPKCAVNFNDHWHTFEAKSLTNSESKGMSHFQYPEGNWHNQQTSPHFFE